VASRGSLEASGFLAGWERAEQDGPVGDATEAQEELVTDAKHGEKS